MNRNICTIFAALFFVGSLFVIGANAQGGRPPDHEIGYFEGNEYNFTAADWLPQHAIEDVQNKIYVVAYPIGWEGLGLSAPFCNPCDHGGNGVDFTDFHDHVLDSIPTRPGYTALRHVYVVLPNYSFLAGINDPSRDKSVSTEYAAHFPVRSEAAVNELLNSTATDDSPLAVMIDAGFYIRVSVHVKPN